MLMLHITFCRQHCAVFFHNVTSLDQPWQLLLVVPLPQSSSSVKTTVHVSPLRARPWMRLFCQSVDHNGLWRRSGNNQFHDMDLVSFWSTKLFNGLFLIPVNKQFSYGCGQWLIRSDKERKYSPASSDLILNHHVFHCPHERGLSLRKWRQSHENCLPCGMTSKFWMHSRQLTNGCINA